MSAFIVSNDHIDALLSYCLRQAYTVSYYNPESGRRHPINYETAEEVGRILLDQNVRSVDHRYGGRIDDDMRNAAANYRFQYYWPHLKAVEVISAVHCLEYQSCETDDWEGSLAWRICQAIKAEAISNLPGYREAPWEIRRQHSLT